MPPYREDRLVQGADGKLLVLEHTAGRGGDVHQAVGVSRMNEPEQMTYLMAGDIGQCLGEFVNVRFHAHEQPECLGKDDRLVVVDMVERIDVVCQAQQVRVVGAEVDDAGRRRIAEAILKAASLIAEVSEEEVEKLAEEVAEAAAKGEGTVSEIAGRVARRLKPTDWLPLAEKIAQEAEKILEEKEAPEVIEVAVPLEKCPKCGHGLKKTGSGVYCDKCRTIYVYHTVKPPAGAGRFEIVEMDALGSICPFCGSHLHESAEGKLCPKCGKLFKLRKMPAENASWSLVLDLSRIRDDEVQIVELEDYDYMLPSKFIELSVAGAEAKVYYEPKAKGLREEEILDRYLSSLERDAKTGAVSILMAVESGRYRMAVKEDAIIYLKRVADLIRIMFTEPRFRSLKKRLVVVVSAKNPYCRPSEELKSLLSSFDVPYQAVGFRIGEERVLEALRSAGVEKPELFLDLAKALPRIIGYLRGGASIRDAVLSELAEDKELHFIGDVAQKVYELGRPLTASEAMRFVGRGKGGRTYYRIELLRSLGLVEAK